MPERPALRCSGSLTPKETGRCQGNLAPWVTDPPPLPTALHHQGDPPPTESGAGLKHLRCGGRREAPAKLPSLPGPSAPSPPLQAGLGLWGNNAARGRWAEKPTAPRRRRRPKNPHAPTRSPPGATARRGPRCWEGGCGVLAPQLRAQPPSSLPEPGPLRHEYVKRLYCGRAAAAGPARRPLPGFGGGQAPPCPPRPCVCSPHGEAAAAPAPPCAVNYNNPEY